MKKIIDLPVIYEADVIPNGCRKNRTVNMIDYHPFEIEDLSDNIPEVIAVANQRSLQVIRKHENILLKPLVFSGLNRTFSSFLISEDEDKFIRSFPEIGFNRISLDNLHKNTLKNNCNDLEDLTHYNLEFLSNKFFFLREFYNKNYTQISNQKIKILLSDNKNKVIQHIQNHLKNYYLINNIFYERFNETILKMKVDPISFNYLYVATGYVKRNESDVLKYNSMMNSNYLYLPLSMFEVLNKNQNVDNIIEVFKPQDFIKANENYLSNNLIGFLCFNLRKIYTYGIDKKLKTKDKNINVSYLDNCLKKMDYEYSLLKNKHEYDILTFQDVLKFSVSIKEQYIELKNYFLQDFHKYFNHTYDINYLEKADEYIEKIIEKFQVYLLNVDMQNTLKDTLKYTIGIKP